jgi:hypothetical protein
MLSKSKLDVKILMLNHKPLAIDDVSLHTIKEI